MAVLIGDNDTQIARLFKRVPFIRSHQIAALLGRKNNSMYRKRLSQLSAPRVSFLINKTKELRRKEPLLKDLTHHVYELGWRGLEHLQELGEGEKHLAQSVRKARMGHIGRNYPHTLMVCDTLVSIELGVKTDPNVGYVSWRGILDKAPETTRTSQNPFGFPVSVRHTNQMGITHKKDFTLIPDGMFALVFNTPQGKRYRLFAIEAERSNRVDCSHLDQNSFLRKYLAYRVLTRDHALQSRLGIPHDINLTVLVLTPNEAKIQTMMDRINELSGGSRQFYFKTIPTFGSKASNPTAELFTQPWLRAGHEPAFVNQAI